jgi:hypothetical protein
VIDGKELAGLSEGLKKTKISVAGVLTVPMARSVIDIPTCSFGKQNI